MINIAGAVSKNIFYDLAGLKIAPALFQLLLFWIHDLVDIYGMICFKPEQWGFSLLSEINGLYFELPVRS